MHIGVFSLRRTGFLILSVLLFAGTFQVRASAAAAPVMEPDRPCSLTIIKRMENEGISAEGDGSPEEISPENGAWRGIGGVVFGARKIADPVSLESGNSWTEGYGKMDPAVKEALGLPEDRSLFTSTEIEEALSELLTASADKAEGTEKAGKLSGPEALEAFLRECGGVLYSAPTDGGGVTRFHSVPAGLYLIFEDNADQFEKNRDEFVYAPSDPFLVSLPMTGRRNAEESGAGTYWQYEVTVYPKNRITRLAKYIVQDSEDALLVRTDDRAAGDTVSQVITAVVPRLPAGTEHTWFSVSDEMEKGLLLRKIRSVYLDAAEGEPGSLGDICALQMLDPEDYRIETGKDLRSFAVTLSESGLRKLNMSGTSVLFAVQFETVLTKEAPDGAAKAVTNTPRLTSATNRRSARTVTGNPVALYTYRLEIEKKGITDGRTAAFRAAKEGSSGLLSFIEEGRGSGVYHLFDISADEAAAKTLEIHPAADGVLVLRGLDEGTYLFTEMATERGKELRAGTFSVRITADKEKNGLLKEAVFTEGGEETTLKVRAGTAYASITNYPAVFLRAGGRGRASVYAAALVCAALAALCGRLHLRKR